jgi:SAM-dependent methyltransferase
MVVTVKDMLTSDRELVMLEMTDLPAFDSAAARNWIDRWDRQQEVYMPDREDRFTALIDAVEAGAGRPDPLVLDLGCGPGSRVGLETGRPVDAVVSTTALHWLSTAELHRLYVTLAGLLRPGGLFLDGDHLLEDETSSPVLRRLDRELEEREGRRRYPDGQPGAENWDEWWQAVAADPALAEAAAERSQGLVHHSNEGAQLGAHTSALRAAGFAEAGTLWQRGSSRVLCGVR